MAKFKKGSKGGPGRPKGSPNKKTVMRAEEVMAIAGFNPTVEMLKQALNKATPLDIKAKLLIELSALINPKAKTSEASNEGNSADDSGTNPELAVISNKRLTELLKDPNVDSTGKISADKGGLGKGKSRVQAKA